MFTGDPFFALDSYPSPANAGIEIESDGSITRFTSTQNNIFEGRWDGGGSFNRSDYDFRFDRISGAADCDGTNKVGIWYPGTTLIAYSLLFSGFGLRNITGTLRMRPTGGGADIDTASLTIELDLS